VIRPADFDSAVSVDPASPVSQIAYSTSPGSRSASATTRVLAAASVALGLLCVFMGVAWLSSKAQLRARTEEVASLRANVEDVSRQRDTLQAQLTDAQRDLETFWRSARVAVTNIEFTSMVDDVPQDVNATDFEAADLEMVRVRIEGTHPLCGVGELSRTIQTRLVMPDGGIWSVHDNHEGVTSTLEVECGGSDHRWSAQEAYGYETTGRFTPGAWRLSVLDRGIEVGFRLFEVH
jgi:hypothetical protein